MDKLVNLLLVAVCIISECDCVRLSLNDVMCPANGKTVVYVTVEKWLHQYVSGNVMYQALLEKAFKEGPNALKVLDNNRIIMKFPSKEMPCGHNFPENTFKSFIMAGDVDSDGIFSSNMCQYVRVAQEVYKNEANQNLLFGNTKPSC